MDFKWKNIQATNQPRNDQNASMNEDFSDTGSFSCGNDDVLDLHGELKGQCTLLNSLHIFGIPEKVLDQASLRIEIVERLCKMAKVSYAKDVEQIYTKKKALIVKFHQMESKEKILCRSENKDIWTNELYELYRGDSPVRIKLCHYMTAFYSKLWFAADKFKSQGRIVSFKLTDKGLVVRRRPNCEEMLFLSEQELKNYIKCSS